MRAFFTTPLADGIETADRFELITEKIKPDRCRTAGWKYINNAATNGKFTSLTHGIRAQVVEVAKKGCQASRANLITGRQAERRVGEVGLRRHPLDKGIDRGQQHHRRNRPVSIGALQQREQASQRFNALANKTALWRETIKGQTIPGRQYQQFCLRHQPRQRIAHRHHPQIITGDIDKRPPRNDAIGKGKHIGAIRTAPNLA